MNNYIKPSIKLIANASPRSSASSCTTSSADMELIQSVIGGVDASKTFGMGETCEISVPLEMYCKFTSVETGAMQVFWS